MDWKHSLYIPGGDKRLYFDYSTERDDFLVCWQKEHRLFGMFESINSFIRFAKTTEKELRCFYEIIMENKWRKPYFDIDINADEMTEDEADDMIETLIYNINNELESFNVSVIVFSSHVPNKKLSYHIVVDGIKVRSSRETKNFAGKVALGNVTRYIDFAVYKPTQQFRILGSRKYGKKNRKTIDYGLCSNFACSDSNELIKRSLVTYTENCVEFSSIQEILDTRLTAFNNGDCEDALRLLHTHYPDTFKVRQYREGTDISFLELGTRHPYKCKIHNRVHDNENAFLIIKKNKGESSMTRVYFNCRRIENGDRHRPQFLGKVSKPKAKNIDVKFSKIDESEEESRKKRIAKFISKREPTPVEKRPRRFGYRLSSINTEI